MKQVYKTSFENSLNILIYCTTDCIIQYKYLIIIIKIIIIIIIIIMIIMIIIIIIKQRI